MNNFYIYKYDYPEKPSTGAKLISATVIFCDRTDINEDHLKEEIKKFYQEYYQTDKIFVIGGEYLKDRLTQVFVTNFDNTFKGVPKRQDTFLKENLYILTFDKDGNLKSENAVPEMFNKTFLNEGLQNIFVKRGGLITSQDAAHHFVFPSGKHCDKFLRTGNILLYSSEIYFIAFALLKHFDENKYDHIYCDTSSINSVAFALIILKNRFSKNIQVPIESFSSYEGLYSRDFTYGKNAFLLISASTSANIISYILENHSIIDRNNILIMYYLGDDGKYRGIEDKVLCNLTKSSSNPRGIEAYPSFNNDNCEFCKNGSYAVEVAGDVFLLEKPKINSITLSVKDPEINLSDFVYQFMSQQKDGTVLKANYKEDATEKYEIYIDYTELLKGVASGRFSDYKDKLNKAIDQYLPSNTKYILSLNDESSKQLSDYILDKIKDNYSDSKLPKIITQNEIATIDSLSNGAIVVVGSCITNGKNLLYISRALRKFDTLRIIYFIGISRTPNKQSLTILKDNLKKGGYSFIEVETIYCNCNSKNSSWLNEIEFLKDFINFIKDAEIKDSSTVVQYLESRKQTLLESSGNVKKGLSQNLFYPRITKDPFEELAIRKNFAFFKFNTYVDDVTQSDIYFTISNIINSLRNTDSNKRNLRQSVFVRNLLHPSNFSRFNDGIIQASILRAASREELAYSIDTALSQEMLNTLETLIKYHEDEQGEALVEFMYALASRKLSLKIQHLKRVIELINTHCNDIFFKCFSIYISKNIIESDKSQKIKPIETKS